MRRVNDAQYKLFRNNSKVILRSLKSNEQIKMVTFFARLNKTDFYLPAQGVGPHFTQGVGTGHGTIGAGAGAKHAAFHQVPRIFESVLRSSGFFPLAKGFRHKGYKTLGFNILFKGYFS